MSTLGGGDEGSLFETDYMAKQRADELENESSNYQNLIALIIKKARNNREYKKYNEATSLLTLGYYKRLGNIDDAMRIVYALVENSGGVEELMRHYHALLNEDKVDGGSDENEQAKSKIINTMLNDYRKRFGQDKVEAYKVLVLQGWINKVENVNELAIIMDNTLTIRDKIGNSWDYEVHVVPLLLDKAFNTEAFIDFTNSTTNFIVGLTRRLKDSYLAVMTAVKILEVSDSPKVMKKYIRDMIKENSKKIDQLNTELAIISSSGIGKITKIAKVREIVEDLEDYNKQIDELMNGIDPKELMLEGGPKR